MGRPKVVYLNIPDIRVDWQLLPFWDIAVRPPTINGPATVQFYSSVDQRKR